jgi:hypothetical protein
MTVYWCWIILVELLVIKINIREIHLSTLYVKKEQGRELQHLLMNLKVVHILSIGSACTKQGKWAVSICVLGVLIWPLLDFGNVPQCRILFFFNICYIEIFKLSILFDYSICWVCSSSSTCFWTTKGQHEGKLMSALVTGIWCQRLKTALLYNWFNLN